MWGRSASQRKSITPLSCRWRFCSWIRVQVCKGRILHDGGFPVSDCLWYANLDMWFPLLSTLLTIILNKFSHSNLWVSQSAMNFDLSWVKVSLYFLHQLCRWCVYPTPHFWCSFHSLTSWYDLWPPELSVLHEPPKSNPIKNKLKVSASLFNFDGFWNGRPERIENWFLDSWGSREGFRGLK